MSEIAKCPICQSTMTLYEEHMDGSDAIACNKCSFTCAEKDLPRVAAAMELAEAKAWRQEVWEATRKPWNFVQVLRERKSIGSVFYILEQSEEDVKLAEKRVLEVFK